MSTDYVPIPCAFYDELEAAAVTRTESEIRYLDKDTEVVVNSLVVDFKTKNKEEFMILENGLSIRLDKIISFNGLKPSDKNYC